MIELGTRRTFPAGQVVFEQGAASDGAYLLVRGRCEVSRDGEVLGTVEAGQVFGELGAFGRTHRSATVRTTVESETVFLTPDQMRRGLTASPQLFLETFLTVINRLNEAESRELLHRDEQRALADVQRTLLPALDRWREEAAFDVSAAWAPASHASGDIYDVIQLADGRVLFWLGDVMGHGAQAALTTAVAGAQMRELARTFRRCDEVVLRLDGYLRDNAPRRFGMSMVVVVLDPLTGMVELSVAGHPPPLLARSARVAPVAIEPGIVLGMPFIGGRGYERTELLLEPGDALLLVSDGLFEVPVDAAGTLLGLQGLADVAADVLSRDRDEPLTVLLERIADLHAGEQDDDRTGLLMTFHGRA